MMDIGSSPAYDPWNIYWYDDETFLFMVRFQVREQTIINSRDHDFFDNRRPYSFQGGVSQVMCKTT